MSRHERRDGLTTWLVRRQVNGAVFGTYEYITNVFRRMDGSVSGTARKQDAAEAISILGEDNADAVADAANDPPDGGHTWHAVRARP